MGGSDWLGRCKPLRAPQSVVRMQAGVKSQATTATAFRCTCFRGDRGACPTSRDFSAPTAPPLPAHSTASNMFGAFRPTAPTNVGLLWSVKSPFELSCCLLVASLSLPQSSSSPFPLTDANVLSVQEDALAHVQDPQDATATPTQGRRRRDQHPPRERRPNPVSCSLHSVPHAKLRSSALTYTS